MRSTHVTGALSTTAAAVLEVDAVAKRFGEVHAVSDVSFVLRQGEIVGLLGPNGAGKTTLLSMVVGLVRPDSGKIVVEGVEVAGLASSRRPRIGFAPQEIGLYLPLSVRENLRFFAAVENLRRAEATDRIDAVIDQLGLGAVADRPAGLLSGGEQRRAHVGCALVTRPPLVLLDEPTVGLDIGGRSEFLDLVRSLAADGVAVCFSSHYLGEVEEVCQRVVVLDHGRTVAQGEVDDLVHAHGGAYVELVLIGGEQRILPCPDSNLGIASVLKALGTDLERVESINVVRPSLETVFLALTGRRFEGCR